MVCNFCLKKNVLLFFREAWNAYFIFRELWKDRFIFRETWSRPPLYHPHPTVPRYTGNTLPMLSWLTVSRFCWLILDCRRCRLSTDTPPIPHLYLTKNSPIHCRYATDAICWPTLDRQENKSQPRCWSILSRWSTDSQPTSRVRIDQVLADIAADIIDRQSTQMSADTPIDSPPKDTWSLTCCLSCMFLFSQRRSQGSYPVCLFINYAYVT